MTADPLDTTVPILITMGACRFEELVSHWQDSETVAEQTRRATHDDMVLWARQQQALHTPPPVIVPIVGRELEAPTEPIQTVQLVSEKNPTEPIPAVQLVAEKDPLPWVQPSIEELQDFQKLWDEDKHPNVAARVTRALTRPFRPVHRARGVQDRSN